MEFDRMELIFEYIIEHEICRKDNYEEISELTDRASEPPRIKARILQGQNKIHSKAIKQLKKLLDTDGFSKLLTYRTYKSQLEIAKKAKEARKRR